MNLQPFCGQQAHRPNLHRPWTYQGFTYASDARIAIRVPALPLNPLDPDQPAPKEATNTAAIFARLPDLATQTAVPIPLPLPDSTFVTCYACNGTGHLGPCPDCEGKGSRTCGECESEHDCRTCDGTGYEPNPTGPDDCTSCNATGKIFQPVRVVVGNGGYGAHYLALIADLPELQFYPNGTDMARFTFAAGNGLFGHGVLMPMMPSRTTAL